jgi:hypothetical protein
MAHITHEWDDSLETFEYTLVPAPALAHEIPDEFAYISQMSEGFGDSILYDRNNDNSRKTISYHVG